MRSMLDVNVVIALLDADHAFHERAHAWWATHENAGWASCPITENGVVRVMSNPAYSATMRFAPAALIFRLRTFVRETDGTSRWSEVTRGYRLPNPWARIARR